MGDDEVTDGERAVEGAGGEPTATQEERRHDRLGARVMSLLGWGSSCLGRPLDGGGGPTGVASTQSE